MSADLRDPAVCSALLKAFKESVAKIVSGKSNEATQISDLHDVMDKMGVTPGDLSINDIYSDEHIHLILATNVKMAQGYGQWKQGNMPGALESAPALELIRFETRKVPRDWVKICDTAAAKLGDSTTATIAKKTGRMVAMKNDPIWYAISIFGLPWPPFKFHSGMGVLDVSYEETVALGVMDAEDDPLPPPELIPDFDRIFVGTMSEINPASLC